MKTLVGTRLGSSMREDAAALHDTVSANEPLPAFTIVVESAQLGY